MNDLKPEKKLCHHFYRKRVSVEEGRTRRYPREEYFSTTFFL